MASTPEEKEPLRPQQRSSLHPPQGDPKAKKISMWIIIGIIGIGIIYIVLYSDLLKKEKTESQTVIPELTQGQGDTVTSSTEEMTSPDTSGQQMMNEPPAETAREQAPVEKKPAPVEKKTPTVEKKAPPTITQGGAFTIYIGSFKDKTRAEKEKARFAKQGEESFISESKGMFRVAVGKYGTRSEAKEAAEKMKSRLDNGYWIDRVE